MKREDKRTIRSRRKARAFLSVALAGLLLILSASACGPSAGKTWTGIRIGTLPDKTVYRPGESFERTGMTVYASYDDGTETEITAYSVSPEILDEGTGFVTVSYKGAEATVSVTVLTPDPSSAESSDVPSNDPNPSSAESSDASSDDPEPDPDPSGDDAHYRFVRMTHSPLRTVYTSGETVDLTGLVLFCEEDGREPVEVFPDEYPTEPLEQTDHILKKTVQLLYKRAPAGEFEITVVPGTAGSFPSSYTEKDADSRENDILPDLRTEPNNNLDFDGTIRNALPNPCPDGVVHNVDELTDYLDYHLFYGFESAVVCPSYGFSDFDRELDAYYYRSGLCAGLAGVKAHELENGWYQVLFRLYPGPMLAVKSDPTPLSEFVAVPFFEAERAADYSFRRIDSENGITVWNSDQAVYALTHGYDVSPEDGSPAETVLDAAASVLREICGDGLTPFQKMYNIYLYFVRNAAYDSTGEVLASHVCDFETESDQFASRFLSFKAEGPLLHGAGVCYGFAKANAILLSLEGLDVVRVVGKDRNTKGRSAFLLSEEDPGQYEEIFCIHSYNYVTVDGASYLDDVTFAYAGAVSVESGKTVSWYRGLCVGLSKSDHETVYKDYEDDAVSSSLGYVPGTFFYQKEFRIPSKKGECSPVASTRAEMENWFNYLKGYGPSLKARSKCLSSSLLVKKSLYSQQDLVSAARSLADSRFSAYRMGLSERTVAGEDYFELLICAKPRG